MFMLRYLLCTIQVFYDYTFTYSIFVKWIQNITTLTINNYVIYLIYSVYSKYFTIVYTWDQNIYQVFYMYLLILVRIMKGSTRLNHKIILFKSATR